MSYPSAAPARSAARQTDRELVDELVRDIAGIVDERGSATTDDLLALGWSRDDLDRHADAARALVGAGLKARASDAPAGQPARKRPAAKLPPASFPQPRTQRRAGR